MKKQNLKIRRGFTLIELLVVIAIIGLLSTMAVISLNDARAKARDARRISDVKQLATILEMEGSDTPGPAVQVAASDAPVDTITHDCTGPGQVSQFANFEDPSDTTDTACVNTSTGICEYAISSNAVPATDGATVGDYQICFWLEKGAGSLTSGLQSIETGSTMGTCD